jgi:hypothetical protein
MSVCLAVCMFQLDNCLTDFDEILYFQVHIGLFFLKITYKELYSKALLRVLSYEM